MRVLPKKDKNSNLYYVYFSGVHNPSCKKFQNEDPKLKDLKKTTSINHFGINEDKNDIQVYPKRQAAITASRKISGFFKIKF